MRGICLTRPVLPYVVNMTYKPWDILCGKFDGHTPFYVVSGVCFTHPLLFYEGSFYFMWGVSYTPHAVLCGELLLHTPGCFMWGVSLTHRAVLSGEFLLRSPELFPLGTFLHTLCCFMWGVCLTHSVLFYVGSLSYTHCAILCGECFCYVGESITCPTMLYYVGSFSEMPHAVLCGEFVLLTPCCFVLGVSLKHPLWFHVVRVSYISDAILRDEFLLHGPCCFTWGVSLTLLFFFFFFFECRKSVFHAHCYLISGFSLTHPMQIYVGRFSNSISCVLLCEEFLLYSQCCCMWDVSLTILSAMY